MVTNRAAWRELEGYTQDLVAAFGQDERVVVWDLYHEPGNSGLGDRSLPLVEAAFAWARGVRPRQPLTAGPWADFRSAMSRRMFELSDVISFHGYDAPAGIQTKREVCRGYGRPYRAGEIQFLRELLQCTSKAAAAATKT
jgi:hypothetical protein